MANILIIEQSRATRIVLKDRLEAESYTVQIVDSLPNGVKMLEQQSFDCVVCDCIVPNINTTPWISIISTKDITIIEQHLKYGAAAHISRPIDMPQMSAAIRQAIQSGAPITQHTAEPPPSKPAIGKCEIIGSAPATKHLKSTIERIAPTPARVLIMGENGTGKELVARTLHEKSPRAKHSFVEVNCAAIPSELIESELFGHRKGAFTGADKDHIGKFEQADKGTLFLDEIGDMSLSAQAKMLRVLQEGTITRVGSNITINVNVRVIAATNKNLAEEVAARRFREDLYHRLSVIIINVPPLRDRREDIPMLIHFFIVRIAKEYNLYAKPIEPDAVDYLTSLPYSGNIRQLRNICERLLLLSTETTISLKEAQLYAGSSIL